MRCFYMFCSSKRQGFSVVLFSSSLNSELTASNSPRQAIQPPAIRACGAVAPRDLAAQTCGGAPGLLRAAIVRPAGSMMDALLAELGMSQYAARFREEEVTEPSLLRSMQPSVLLQELEVRLHIPLAWTDGPPLTSVRVRRRRTWE